MEDKYVLNKLAEALTNLSDKDLHKLAAIVKHPAAVVELGNLIESILALRKTERNIISSTEKRKESKISAGETRAYGTESNIKNDRFYIRSVEDVKKVFKTLLENRNFFPGTKDVVEAVNSEFQCGINYSDYRKRGRKDVIQTCLSHLANFPERKQISLIKSFFGKVYQKHGELDQYRNFFRILAGYE
jgi:hypothetical protein